MKKILIPLFAALLLMPGYGSAQSAVSPQDQLHKNFTASEPGKEQLRSFEARAQEKISEFAGYIGIIANSAYDEKLRKHTKKSALALFESPGSLICDSILSAGDTVPVKVFFDRQAGSGTLSVEITGLYTEKELTPAKDSCYRGRIVFTQQCTLYSKNGEKNGEKVSQKKAEIVLKKVSKEFGGSRKEVWEVMLGDMY